MTPTAASAVERRAAAAVRRARAHAYGLLARLILKGADPKLLGEIRRTPGLRDGFVDTTDDEALAADHYQLFGMLAPPYSTAYLVTTPEAKDGVVEAIRSACSSAGFRPTLSDVSQDHLGMLLAFLSFADHAAADAAEDDLDSVATDLEALVAQFIDRWVLSWLPVWVVAAARHGGAWGDLARLIGAFVAAHRKELNHPVQAPAPERTDFAHDLLDDPATDLRRVGAWLATPRQAGLWFSRADIADIARRHGAPCGFGQREQLLENLLKSAANYGELPGVAEALEERCRELAAALEDSGVDGELLRPWRDASKHTANMLRRLAAAARQVSKRAEA